MSKVDLVQVALAEASRIAERVGRETHYGPCDTNHSGERAGRNIAEAIREYGLPQPAHLSKPGGE